jgi:hypothetical protein
MLIIIDILLLTLRFHAIATMAAPFTPRLRRALVY